MSFPKILHIGQPFNKKSGGGITISNLFKGWPKERLAVATNFNLSGNLDISVCEKYYQLGYNGKLHPFPLNVFLPKIQCGPYMTNINEDITKQKYEFKKSKFNNIYKLLTIFLNFIGVYNVLYKLKITPEFKNWLKAFNPDIIYSQLASLELIRFVSEIQDFTNKPVVLHFMDDWPVTINKPGLLYLYWKRVIDKELRQLLDKSSVLMSICDAMSEEYKIRYNKEFIPFHNPIDIKNWLPFAKKDWTIKEKFTILYAGRIGRGIEKSIVDISYAVNNLCNTHDNIVFEIQTLDISSLEKVIKFNNHVKWLKPIEYSKLPEKFSSVDLLVLPEDFDSDSVEFLKYSIQTKVAEYMISGTPIMVYADKQTALAKYAIKDGWAYVVTDNSKIALSKAIVQLYSNPLLRRKLSEKAIEIAIRNEDADIVRERFQQSFMIH